MNVFHSFFSFPLIFFLFSLTPCHFFPFLFFVPCPNCLLLRNLGPEGHAVPQTPSSRYGTKYFSVLGSSAERAKNALPLIQRPMNITPYWPQMNRFIYDPTYSPWHKYAANLRVCPMQGLPNFKCVS